MTPARLGRLYRSCSLTQIAVFEAVARLGSITRAADEVCLAQPTVSLQMKRLSEALGTSLFEMRGRRLQLTPAGQELYSACRQIMERLAEVQRLVATLPVPMPAPMPGCLATDCPIRCAVKDAAATLDLPPPPEPPAPEASISPGKNG